MTHSTPKFFHRNHRLLRTQSGRWAVSTVVGVGLAMLIGGTPADAQGEDSGLPLDGVSGTSNSSVNNTQMRNTHHEPVVKKDDAKAAKPAPAPTPDRAREDGSDDKVRAARANALPPDSGMGGSGDAGTEPEPAPNDRNRSDIPKQLPGTGDAAVGAPRLILQPDTQAPHQVFQ